MSDKGIFANNAKTSRGTTIWEIWHKYYQSASDKMETVVKWTYLINMPVGWFTYNHIFGWYFTLNS